MQVHKRMRQKFRIYYYITNYYKRKKGKIYIYTHTGKFDIHKVLGSTQSLIRRMAGLFDKQAEIYLDARPTYPSDLYSMAAALTPDHSLAWDVGTGNGQAAIAVSPFFPLSLSLIHCSLVFLFFYFIYLLLFLNWNLIHLSQFSSINLI